MDLGWTLSTEKRKEGGGKGKENKRRGKGEEKREKRGGEGREEARGGKRRGEKGRARKRITLPYDLPSKCTIAAFILLAF